MKRMMMMLATGVMAVALVACDSANDDSGSGPDGNPAPIETSAPTEPTPTEPMDDFERVEELAPIEEIEVLFAESFPVQHRLHIVSGLPSGCAAFERVDVERDGTTFNVEVINTMPAPDEDIACTMIYGYHETTVELGSDLEVGAEYTVDVNGETMTFVAQ